MNEDSIRSILHTMCDFNTVKMTQTFTSVDGHSLAVTCLHGTHTFEVTDSKQPAPFQLDSVEQAIAYITGFLASHKVNITS